MMTSHWNRKYSRVSPVDPGRTSEENQTFSNESVGHQEDVTVNTLRDYDKYPESPSTGRCQQGLANAGEFIVKEVQEYLMC